MKQPRVAAGEEHSMESRERSTTVTDAEHSTLVLKDQVGSYFLLPPETLERCRVPAAQAAALDQLINEQQDVQGYVLPLVSFAVGGLVGIWSAAVLEDAISTGLAPIDLDSIKQQMGS
jgi:hypothetical protein